MMTQLPPSPFLSISIPPEQHDAHVRAAVLDYQLYWNAQARTWERDAIKASAGRKRATRLRQAAAKK